MGVALKVAGELSVADLKNAANTERHPKVRERILIVRAILGGSTVPEAGAAFSLSERQIRTWVHRYNQDGLAGLRDRPKPGQPVHLKSEFLNAFKARIDAGATPADQVCVLRGKDIQRILREEFHAEYSVDGVYALLHRLGFSSLVPRPRHPKTDPDAQSVFKKTSEIAWALGKAPNPANRSKFGSKTKRVSANKAR